MNDSYVPSETTGDPNTTTNPWYTPPTVSFGSYSNPSYSFIDVGDKLYRLNTYTGQAWWFNGTYWKLIKEETQD